MLDSSQKSVTLRDVAALAGTDKGSASRALNGKGRVSAHTREAVLKAAKELRFQPNLSARNLAHGRSPNAVAHIPTHDLGVLTEQAFSVEPRLDEMDLDVQSYSPPVWVNQFERKLIAVVNKVRRQRPVAIICGSPLVPKAVDELRLFIQEGGVVVNYGAKIDLECDQVLFDPLHRAYLATRHLLELGHRELGFCVHGKIQPDWVELAGFARPLEEYSVPIWTELAGFARALEEYSVPLQEEWIFGGGNYEEGGARLAEAFLSWPKKPTGMCIVNDFSAATFVMVLSRNGLTVPDDVSVVGFDDARAARYALVPLTSMSYPLEPISRQVAEFTQSRLQGYDGPPRTETMPSELIVRSSTAPYRLKGPG